MALSPLFPQLWSARITYFASQHSAFLPNATRQWEGEAVYGNTIKVPTIDRNVTLRDYDRTADLAAPEDIDATTQDLVIDQEKYFNFALEDLDARQSRIPGATLIDLKSQGAGLKVSSAVDAHVASTLAGITANTLLVDRAAAAFDLDFIAEVKKLATLHGLLQSGLVIVTTPELVEGVEKGIIDKTWGDAVTGRLAPIGQRGASADPVAAGNGLAITLGGFPVYVTNSTGMRARSSGSGAITMADRGDRSRMWVYNPLDLALVMQVNKVESYRQEKRFGTGVKGLVNYGTKALNAGRIMRFTFNDVT